MIAKCNMCPQDDPNKEPFKVPWDSVGKELMAQHLETEHGVKNA